jgi:hypothetical protein
MSDACARGVHQHWQTHQATGFVRCGLCFTVFARECSCAGGRSGPNAPLSECRDCHGIGLVPVRNLSRPAAA